MAKKSANRESEIRKRPFVMQSNQRIRVMSFNMRSNVKGDGINCFANRAPLVRELFKKEQPDLIGLQEVVDMTYNFLYETLSDTYELLGCGRNTECRGERCMLAVRRERFEIISFGTFWLSETPDVPGSMLKNSDQSQNPRVVCSALLKPTGSERLFRFVNTHLDHIGVKAREKELEILRSQLPDDSVPTALTGDFNAFPDSSAISCFRRTMGTRGWRDATENLGGTFHDYGRCQPLTKIDYIFTNCPFENSRVLTDPARDGIYCSDHYAVATDLIL